MKKGQTSKTNGIQNFLCPFTEIRVTQVENVGSHLGTKSVDVASKKAGTKAAYYAPADIKCVWAYPKNGESRWQTVNKVRCPNGYVGIVTFEIAHDETFNAYVGMTVKQGEQLGNMEQKEMPMASTATSSARRPVTLHTSRTSTAFTSSTMNPILTTPAISTVRRSSIPKKQSGNMRRRKANARSNHQERLKLSMMTSACALLHPQKRETQAAVTTKE